MIKLGKRFDQFTRARLTLTSFYTGIILLILLFFSVAFYTVQTRDFTRVVIQRQFGNRARLPLSLLQADRNELREQVEELRHSLIVHLIEIDLGVLALGGLLSYVLAGVTLKPIQMTLQKQKEFISDASHELRTPLAAIISGTEVTLRKKNQDKSHYIKALEQNESVSKGMARIVEELLTLSRIDSGENHIKKEEVRVEEVVNEAISQIQPLAREKGLKLKFESMNKLVVQGDKDKLRQLIVILLDNAVKYTSKGGVEVSLKDNWLSVKDTGIGISNEEKSKIFERFYRADKARNTEGAGLGLSIAKEIANMHSIRLALESSSNKGSIFKIIF